MKYLICIQRLRLIITYHLTASGRKLHASCFDMNDSQPTRILSLSIAFSIFEALSMKEVLPPVSPFSAGPTERKLSSKYFDL